MADAPVLLIFSAVDETGAEMEVVVLVMAAAAELDGGVEVVARQITCLSMSEAFLLLHCATVMIIKVIVVINKRDKLQIKNFFYLFIFYNFSGYWVSKPF